MDSKFADFYNSINNMRIKVIEGKGGQQVQGLSKPVVSNNKVTKKRQSKTQEKN